MSSTASSIPPHPYLQNVIPPEIRIMILRYLLVGPNVCWLSPESAHGDKHRSKPRWRPSTTCPYDEYLPDHEKPSKHSLYPQILATCRQFNIEGHELLYGQNDFQNMWGGDLGTNVRPLSSDALASIKHLIFCNAYLASDFGYETEGIASQFPNVKNITLYLDNYNALEKTGLQILSPEDDEFDKTDPRPWDDYLHPILMMIRDRFPHWQRFEVRFEEEQCKCKSLYNTRLVNGIPHVAACEDNNCMEFRLRDYSEWLWAHKRYLPDNNDSSNDTAEGEATDQTENSTSEVPEDELSTATDPASNNAKAVVVKSDVDTEYRIYEDRGYATHKRAKYPLPLSFTLQHARIRVLRQQLGKNRNQWRWSFSTQTSWLHPPRIQMQMVAVKGRKNRERDTKVECKVTGDWGHMTRIEDLEIEDVAVVAPEEDEETEDEELDF
ncbi:hypothetical protein BT63DRAFT_453562 [Microthyrium microscopicum]|uniref:F-box domain-containing protein n=1 Tax=Microthyrium microscopicum TaxID=703497 RepID=A0A6A6UHZ0_9PEZI|nr:hypothetical protein BT63DRAFT_453562 [Microthyrium microscopicum]